MSNYRVKHFWSNWTDSLENEVNEFIENNNIDVLRYTLHIFDNSGRGRDFTGVLEYEELDHEN